MDMTSRSALSTKPIISDVGTTVWSLVITSGRERKWKRKSFVTAGMQETAQRPHDTRFIGRWYQETEEDMKEMNGHWFLAEVINVTAKVWKEPF